MSVIGTLNFETVVPMGGGRNFTAHWVLFCYLSLGQLRLLKVQVVFRGAQYSPVLFRNGNFTLHFSFTKKQYCTDSHITVLKYKIHAERSLGNNYKIIKKKHQILPFKCLGMVDCGAASSPMVHQCVQSTFPSILGKWRWEGLRATWSCHRM